MPRIFLSFRKADARLVRDHVYEALTNRFGTDEIFKAGESIPPGTDFAGILRQQATVCEVMLVLIGPAWLGAGGEDGVRLLDRPYDWVRVEIATAMKAGNRVVPVLLGDAVMLPEASALPKEIADLAGLQFLRVSETHLASGLDRFVGDVMALLPDLARETTIGSAAPAGAEPVPAAPHSPESRVSMEAHVTDGGSAFQAARDQTIRLA